MADEQTPQSDMIDNAIRQAEQQLEAKLEALRMSALGDTTPSEAPADSEAAVLRPTGGPTEDAASWQEVEGDDLTFEPAPVSAPRERPTTASNLTPSWEEDVDVELPEPQQPTRRGRTRPTYTGDAVMRTPRRAPRPPRPEATYDPTPYEPGPHGVTPSEDWTRTYTPAPASTGGAPATPGEDEMRFWAHTRTALRNLQQLTDAIPDQVTEDVTAHVDRIIHHQLQQGLTRLTSSVESVIEQAVASPNSALRLLRNELPQELDRIARDVRELLREDLDDSSRSLHDAVREDITRLEETVAANTSRMAQGTSESIDRVERDIDLLGESIIRFERGLHTEFGRVEGELRDTIHRVEASLREELLEPTETVKKLDEELPARFGRIERTVLDQLQGSQRDVTRALSTLEDATRTTLERVGTLTNTMQDERTRTAEDMALLVDTVTTGWEGLAGAIKTLYEQNDLISQRIAGIEQRITQLRDLEDAVEATMSELRTHIRELAPAPVIVTVSHAEAEVHNTTRAGWSAEERD